MVRIGELVIATLLLVVTLPLMLTIALAIKWESPGPAFYRQNRIGPNGRCFQSLRFRTTLHDPENQNTVWSQKTTPVGQFLRYTRIEGLPQLINVVRGEMCLVGQDGSSRSFLD